MNVLVIGGTGFIGYHVTRALLNKGHHPDVISLPQVIELGNFPPEVEFILKDVNTISDADLLRIFRNYEAFVFASGEDDRTLPNKPAWEFFYQGNVLPSIRLVRLAKEAGMKRAVFMGSYFAYFNRIWPEMRLADKHPYIRSRMVQIERAMKEAAEEIRLTFLELPFIFGSIPGKIPMWRPLVRYIDSRIPKFAPQGGTSVVSVSTVANACVAALESDLPSQILQIGSQNHSWRDLYFQLGNKKKNLKVFYLPGWLFRTVMWLVVWVHSLMGKQGGLNFAQLPKLLEKNLFIETETAGLDFQHTDMEEAFEDTRLACSSRKQ